MIEWSANKAKINREKHDVKFEEAVEFFFDPLYQTGDASSNNEKREFIIGYSSYYRLLLVVFVECDRRNRDRAIDQADPKL